MGLFVESDEREMPTARPTEESRIPATPPRRWPPLTIPGWSYDLIPDLREKTGRVLIMDPESSQGVRPYGALPGLPASA